MLLKKYIFIDRDGVINLDSGYLHDIDNLSLYLDAIAFLKIALTKNYKICIVTNQSGIGRGFFTEKTFDIFMRKYLKLLYNHGLKKIIYRHCPHTPKDQCNCRKPSIGLIKDIVSTEIIDFKNSWMIGDKFSDIEFGFNNNIKNLCFIHRGNKSFARKKNDNKKINYLQKDNLFDLIKYV